MPEGVVEKQPDRAAVGDSEVGSFNSRPKFVLRNQTHSFSTTLHFWLYLPNAEMTVDLEATRSRSRLRC
jgi:hypothetical protein